MKKSIILLLALLLTFSFQSVSLAFDEDSDTSLLMVKVEWNDAWVSVYVDWNSYFRSYATYVGTGGGYTAIDKLTGSGTVSNSDYLANEFGMNWTVTNFIKFKEYKNGSLSTTKTGSTSYNQGLEPYYNYYGEYTTDHNLSNSYDWTIKNDHKMTFLTTAVPQWWTDNLQISY